MRRDLVPLGQHVAYLLREGHQVVSGSEPGGRYLQVLEEREQPGHTDLGAELAAGQDRRGRHPVAADPGRVGVEVAGDGHGHPRTAGQVEGHGQAFSQRPVVRPGAGGGWDRPPSGGGPATSMAGPPRAFSGSGSVTGRNRLLDQWPAEIGVLTWWKEFVPRPNAFTGLLSQMPTLLLKMWLCAITTRTWVPPENTRTPVVFMSVGETGESSVSPSRLFVPILLPMILLPLRSSNWPGISVCACMVTPDSPLPAMKLPSTRLLYDAVPAEAFANRTPAPSPSRPLLVTTLCTMALS